MIARFLISLLALLFLVNCQNKEEEQPVSSQVIIPGPEVNRELTELKWEDLLPEGEDEALAKLYEEFYGANGFGGAIAEGTPGDYMPQLGTFKTVETLNNLIVRIPGFIVPLESQSTGIYTEFLLVPYFGACIHTPPPPPNQIIYVHTDKGVRLDDVWIPYYIEGQLTTAQTRNELGNTAYTMELDALIPYEY